MRGTYGASRPHIFSSAASLLSCPPIRRPGGARLCLFSAISLLAVCALSTCAPPKQASVQAAAGQRGVVVSSHPAATAIGLAVLEAGGNAVDAAVATGLAVGVADPFNSGIGGGGFLLVRRSDGTVFTVDGRETAPAAASADMFLRDGELRPEESRLGPRAVGVPGLLACYVEALERAGSRPLSALIEPSITLAEEGVVLDLHDQEKWRPAADSLRLDPASKKIFLHPDGSPRKAGERLKQPDLAETYRRIASKGLDFFYRGEFSQRLASYMKENGGLISLADMQAYRAIARPPVTAKYH
jgi:gamma-glutamyltranspeptidase / glutathione hydrolase